MRDFKIENGSFTHKSMSGSWSRLDRFLATTDWTEQFGEFQEQVGSLGGSDHRLVSLTAEKLKGGPRTFRFQLYLFEKPGLPKLMEKWWTEKVVEGNAGYRISKKELLHLK